MTRAPNDRLAGQIRYRAAFMRAFCGEGSKLISRLQNDYALAAHWHDDEFVLLKLGGLIARQMCRTGRSGLGQWFEIANNWVSDARDPCDGAGAENEIKEATSRRHRVGSGLSFHSSFFYSDEGLRSSVY